MDDLPLDARENCPFSGQVSGSGDSLFELGSLWGLFGFGGFFGLPNSQATKFGFCKLLTCKM